MSPNKLYNSLRKIYDRMTPDEYKCLPHDKFFAIGMGMILVQENALESVIIEAPVSHHGLIEKTLFKADYKGITIRWAQYQKDHRCYFLINKNNAYLDDLAKYISDYLRKDCLNKKNTDDIFQKKIHQYLKLNHICKQHSSDYSETSDKMLFIVAKDSSTGDINNSMRYVVCICGNNHQSVQNTLKDANAVMQQIAPEYMFILQEADFCKKTEFLFN